MRSCWLILGVFLGLRAAYSTHAAEKEWNAKELKDLFSQTESIVSISKPGRLDEVDLSKNKYYLALLDSRPLSPELIAAFFKDYPIVSRNWADDLSSAVPALKQKSTLWKLLAEEETKSDVVEVPLSNYGMQGGTTPPDSQTSKRHIKPAQRYQVSRALMGMPDPAPATAIRVQDPLDTRRAPQGKNFTAFEVGSSAVQSLVFSSEARMGQAFDRIYYFAENAKHRGEILTDEALTNAMLASNFRGGEGHDYQVKELADFFSIAEKQKISLNASELQIKNYLLNAGLVKKSSDGSYLGAENSVILFWTPTSSLETLRHEFNHGVYFSDPSYRQAVAKLWKELSPADKEWLRDFMVQTFPNYNFTGDQDLFLREVVAYFRDPYELMDSYVRKLDPQKEKRILAFAQKIKELDKFSSAYIRTEAVMSEALPKTRH